jgi:hypothetical protein
MSSLLVSRCTRITNAVSCLTIGVALACAFAASAHAGVAGPMCGTVHYTDVSAKKRSLGVSAAKTTCRAARSAVRRYVNLAMRYARAGRCRDTGCTNANISGWRCRIVSARESAESGLVSECFRGRRFARGWDPRFHND